MIMTQFLTLSPFLAIDWQPSVDAFSLGPFTVRWYALCWIVGILLAYFVVKFVYARQGIDPVVGKKGEEVSTGKFDPLLVYCFIGVLLGARLGHCIFYDPQIYLTSWKGVVEMFLPIMFLPDGGWKFTGYAGLASHGGTIGLFLALLLYIRNRKVGAWTVLDSIGLAAPLTSCFIRLGNLMNSEIIGKPTDAPWAFIFHTRDALVDGQLGGRHPAQLYEALAYLLIFFVGWAIYLRRSRQSAKALPAKAVTDGKGYAVSSRGDGLVGTGFYFGFCLATIFLFRFFVEFLKEVQGGADDGTTALDMGQMLSLPFVVVGAVCMVRGLLKKREL